MSDNLPSRTRLRSAVAIAIALALVALPSSAVADPGTDGFWYYDSFHIQAAHDAGVTGAGVTIAVIDGQINLDVPTLQGADISVHDLGCHDASGALIPAKSTDISAQHGTNVVSYLVGTGAGYPGQTGVKGIAPGAKILYYSDGAEGAKGSSGTAVVCFEADGTTVLNPLGAAIYAAVKAGADIISISQGGSPTVDSVPALALAVHNGVVVVSGVSNDLLAVDAGADFPSSGNGVVSVQSADSSSKIQGDHTDFSTDVVGPGVGVVWQGDTAWETQKYDIGTSIATPIVAGFVALVASKYPKATGNQLIQTLIRNTGGEDAPLNYDPAGKFGYGMASATHMLKVDPTQYDDVNPLISDKATAVPTAQQIAAASEAASTPTPSWDAGNPPATTPSLPPIFLIGGIAVGGILLIVVLIIIIVAVSRRTKNPPVPPAGGAV